MKYIVPTIIASVLFVLSPAYAGSCGKGNHVHNLQEMASKYFSQMDANGDEIVTKEEFEARNLRSESEKIIKEAVKAKARRKIAELCEFSAIVSLNKLFFTFGGVLLRETVITNKVDNTFVLDLSWTIAFRCWTKNGRSRCSAKPVPPSRSYTQPSSRCW